MAWVSFLFVVKLMLGGYCSRNSFLFQEDDLQQSHLHLNNYLYIFIFYFELLFAEEVDEKIEYHVHLNGNPWTHSIEILRHFRVSSS